MDLGSVERNGIDHWLLIPGPFDPVLFGSSSPVPKQLATTSIGAYRMGLGSVYYCWQNRGDNADGKKLIRDPWSIGDRMLSAKMDLGSGEAT